LAGLLCGIGPREIRLLCDDPWSGGHGSDLHSVTQMTLDQIFMLLTDRKNLRHAGKRSNKVTPLELASMVSSDKDGFIKGRAADGTPIKAKIMGKSLARRMMEEKAAKEKIEEQKPKRKRRRQR